MGLDLGDISPPEQRNATVSEHGNELHQLSQITDTGTIGKSDQVPYSGAQAMRDEVSAINKLDPGLRNDIFQKFQKLSVNDPLFINDIKMTGDKLEFASQHKVTAELKSAEQNLLSARAQNFKDGQSGNVAAMIGADRHDIFKATNNLQSTEREIVKTSGNSVLEIPAINYNTKK